MPESTYSPATQPGFSTDGYSERVAVKAVTADMASWRFRTSTLGDLNFGLKCRTFCLKILPDLDLKPVPVVLTGSPLYVGCRFARSGRPRRLRKLF